jgi:sterol desaturase/sphingolipid hydroxylase (fatty acid hydroxylase superfamily)
VGERLLVSPRFHRIHHGELSAGEDGRNYAVLLPVWDWIFRTGDFDRTSYPRTGDPQAPEILATGGWWHQQVAGLKELGRVLRGR